MTARSTKSSRAATAAAAAARSGSGATSNSQPKTGGVAKRPRGRPPKSQKVLEVSIDQKPKAESKVETKTSSPAIETAPLTPVSPIELDSDKANEPEPSIPEISQEELEMYLKEYASTATDSDSLGDSSAPLSPILDLENETSFGELGGGGATTLFTTCSEEFAPTFVDIPEQNIEPKLDDYLNFINDVDTEPVPIPTEISQKRPAPFCIYRKPTDSHYISSSFNPNNRTLIAAFNTMAPDVQYSSREAYLQSVLLAAASLTQRSLMTGRARETMAPALGTSY